MDLQRAFPEVVLVRACSRDSTGRRSAAAQFAHSEDGVTSLSSSGFVISLQEGLIVTSASIVKPFISSEPGVDPCHPNLLQETQFEVHFDGAAAVCNSEQTETKLHQIHWHQATFVCVMSHLPLNRAILRLTASNNKNWRFEGRKLQLVGDKSFLHQPCIAVLKVETNWLALAKQLLPVSLPPWESAVTKGQGVVVVGSPFGVLSPHTFSNCLSTGIVCNILKADDSSIDPLLYFIDARCLPGNEGSPVYAQSSGSLIGMLLPRLERIDDFAMELYPVLPCAELYKLFASKLNGQSLNLTTARQLDCPVWHSNESSVVAVRVNSHWGSGCVLDRSGHILTNAHLLRPFVSTYFKHTNPQQSILQGWLEDGSRVSVRFRHSSAYLPAQVVYVSPTHADVAVLRVQGLPSTVRPIRIQHDRSPFRGMPVVAIGYPVFPPDHGVSQPWWTTGVLSKVVQDRHRKPCMLQSTAAIHQGNSGGGLFDRDGYFQGLVTLNARDKNRKTIPHLNFHIPSAVLTPVQLFVETQNLKHLFAFHQPDQEMSALWQLTYGPSTQKERPAMPSNSKFARYLSKLENHPHQSEAYKQQIGDIEVKIYSNL